MSSKRTRISVISLNATDLLHVHPEKGVAGLRGLLVLVRGSRLGPGATRHLRAPAEGVTAWLGRSHLVLHGVLAVGGPRVEADGLGPGGRVRGDVPGRGGVALRRGQNGAASFTFHLPVSNFPKICCAFLVLSVLAVATVSVFIVSS